MKRTINIGFDAKQVMSDGADFGSYSRLVIEAMARTAPRNTYFRPYVEARKPHSGYEAIERMHNIETMEPDGALWRKLHLAWRLWHVSRDLANAGVELYHGLTELVPMGLTSRNIRSVVTVHNMAFLYDTSILNSPYHLIHRLYMSRMLNRVDRIVAVSECVKRDIITHFHIYPDKVDVVYNGVAHRFTEPVTEQKVEEVATRYDLPAKYILGVGKQLERRNMLNIIKILPIVDHELHYVVVGKPTAYTARMQRAARELGVADRVHFISGIADEDMPALYKRAAMLVNLSRYEGFATSVAEAMSVGTPCILTRTSSMEEVAESAALYVDANSRDELIGAVRSLCNDDELRTAYIDAGMRHASRYRPEVVAFNLVNCYRRVGVDIRG